MDMAKGYNASVLAGRCQCLCLCAAATQPQQEEVSSSCCLGLPGVREVVQARHYLGSLVLTLTTVPSISAQKASWD